MSLAGTVPSGVRIIVNERDNEAKPEEFNETADETSSLEESGKDEGISEPCDRCKKSGQPCVITGRRVSCDLCAKKKRKCSLMESRAHDQPASVAQIGRRAGGRNAASTSTSAAAACGNFGRRTTAEGKGRSLHRSNGTAPAAAANALGLSGLGLSGKSPQASADGDRLEFRNDLDLIKERLDQLQRTVDAVYLRLENALRANLQEPSAPTTPVIDTSTNPAVDWAAIWAPPPTPTTSTPQLSAAQPSANQATGGGATSALPPLDIPPVYDPLAEYLVPRTPQPLILSPIIWPGDDLDLAGFND